MAIELDAFDTYFYAEVSLLFCRAIFIRNVTSQALFIDIIAIFEAMLTFQLVNSTLCKNVHLISFMPANYFSPLEKFSILYVKRK